jgi:hypothetical protein
MSIYDLFSVDKLSHAYDIETAGKSIMRNLNIGSLKQWLNENNINYNNENVDILLQNMRRHVSASASVLLDPGLKDCYDAWLCSLSNPSKQSIAKARMMYMNAHNCDVQFGEGCFDMISTNDVDVCLHPVTSTTFKTNKSLNCRWCKKQFDLNSFSILQCKCTARIGHSKCADDFYDEYKNRCPVCRTNLLKRKEISKYMFWGIENKFKL